MGVPSTGRLGNAQQSSDQSTRTNSDDKRRPITNILINNYTISNTNEISEEKFIRDNNIAETPNENTQNISD